MNESLLEILRSKDLINLLNSNTYASQYILSAPITPEIVAELKNNKVCMENLISMPRLVDRIRTIPALRYAFNKNRIRLLAVTTRTDTDTYLESKTYTVPSDWPLDFMHVQLIGAGGRSTNSSPVGKCGEYVQAVIPVEPGQQISFKISRKPLSYYEAATSTVFGDLVAQEGMGAKQLGCFLVKASNGAKSPSATNSGAPQTGGEGGFEGGVGGDGAGSDTTKGTGGTGDGSLGHCENTGGDGGNSSKYGNGLAGVDGAGGGGEGMSSARYGAGGGGGYGGAGGSYGNSNGYGGYGGSGAIIITCPDGYIPQYTVYNKIDGVTAWRRDTNMFNAF